MSCRPTWRDKWRDDVGFAPGWSRIPDPATGNLTRGDGESWRRLVPAWLFRSRRLYGNGIPDGALTKKARCLSTASSLLTRDSVGIRTQDPQLRRLLLYPAELPNHPYVSTRRLPFCEEQVCKYRDFLFNGNVSRRKFLQILYALWSITYGYRPARNRHLSILT